MVICFMIVGMVLGATWYLIQSNQIQTSVKIEPLMPYQPSQFNSIRQLQVPGSNPNEKLTTQTEIGILESFAKEVTSRDLITESAKATQLGGPDATSNELGTIVNDVSVIKTINAKNIYDSYLMVYIDDHELLDRQNTQDFLSWLIKKGDEKVFKLLLSEVEDNISSIESLDLIEVAKVQEEIADLIKYHDQVIDDRITKISLQIDTLTNQYLMEIDDGIAKTSLQIDTLTNQYLMEIDDDINHTRSKIQLLKNKNRQQTTDSIIQKTDQVEAVLQEYDSNKQDQIMFLKEQSAIAKELGIDYLYESTSPNTEIWRPDVRQAYFVLGSIAIEKQIAEIISRNEVADLSFVPNLRRLEKELSLVKKQLDQDEYIEGLRDLETNLELLLLKKNDTSYVAGLRELESKLAGLEKQRSQEFIEEEGLRELESQLSSLEKQRSQEFIEGLREKQIRLGELQKNITSNNLRVQLESLLQGNEPPQMISYDITRIKTSQSKRSLTSTLIFGLIVGTFFGVLTSLLRGSFVKRSTSNL